MPYDLNRLNAALGAVLAAERALHRAIEEELPNGCRVRWMHGDAIREATVIDHSSGRLLVKGYSGKQYWIDAWRVFHDGCACA